MLICLFSNFSHEVDPRLPQSTGGSKNDSHELHFGVRSEFNLDILPNRRF